MRAPLFLFNFREFVFLSSHRSTQTSQGGRNSQHASGPHAHTAAPAPCRAESVLPHSGPGRPQPDAAHCWPPGCTRTHPPPWLPRWPPAREGLDYRCARGWMALPRGGQRQTSGWTPLSATGSTGHQQTQGDPPHGVTRRLGRPAQTTALVSGTAFCAPTGCTSIEATAGSPKAVPAHHKGNPV